MTDRRQFIAGIAGISTVGIAGCGESEETDAAEETDTVEEEVGVVLPPDSSELFRGGELSEHNFAESSFTEGQVETVVSEFDLQNADASSVTNVQAMFREAESFNQDISGWCTEQINSTPNSFDSEAGFEGDDAKQPNWGEPC